MRGPFRRGRAESRGPENACLPSLLVSLHPRRDGEIKPEAPGGPLTIDQHGVTGGSQTSPPHRPQLSSSKPSPGFTLVWKIPIGQAAV